MNMKKVKSFLGKSIATILFISLFMPLVEVRAASKWQDNLYDRYGLEVNGFVEGRGGIRVRQDPVEKEWSLAEMRMQLDAGKDLGWGVLQLKGDFVADSVIEKVGAELRTASITFSPIDMLDLKAGRQVLTWGTGDLIFINDMFPKDWQSFFVGRDDEYLKAPSDAFKASLFFELFNLDLVYSPIFNGSKYVNGERLSFYNPMIADFSGRDSQMIADERNSAVMDAEYSGRVSKNISGTEVAFYSYSGFWKEPEGIDMATNHAYYPRLSVYGASVRTSLGGGVGHLETGYYDSRKNRDGDNLTNRNSELRFLAGFEHELGPDFTGSFQYYLEWMDEYSAYEMAVKEYGDGPKRDEYRHLLTVRLTKMFMNQNLIISLFTYYSPSDQDGYSRPKLRYKINDSLTVEGGANIFWGTDNYTFWGRFKKNSNLYAGVRYSF